MILGLNDGLLPHQRSFDDPEAMEEERRLFYVGITRAKDRLYLFHSLNRYSYGYLEPMLESRYYQDIPPTLRAEVSSPYHYESQTRSPSDLGSWKDFQQTTSRPIAEEVQFHPGQKVHHPKWGEGLVLNSQLQNDDEIVDVFFDGIGKKKLIASLADMKTLS
jgi:DNA helicase-2/ATP-dependent DNA helicase PcrA